MNRLPRYYLESPVWREISRLRARHMRQFDDSFSDLMDLLKEELDLEVDRLSQKFRGNRLNAHLAPIAEELADYLNWLQWCGWCSLHLAAALGLNSRSDARRLAVALIAYMGPRLIDDAADGHLDYKGKRQTLLGRLSERFPSIPAATLAVHTSLIGFWVLIYGANRLRQLGFERCSSEVLLLCQDIAPAAVMEPFQARPLTIEEYQTLVRRKSATYDMIIYGSLLAPLSEPLRTAVKDAVRGVSELAQYLNDWADRDEDAGRNQHNLYNLLDDEESYWEYVLERAGRVIDGLPREPTARNAVATLLFETFKGAASIDAGAGKWWKTEA